MTIGQGKLESGYQFRYQRQTGTFLYQNAILGSSAYETVPEFSADIKVLNQIHGLYSQYAGKFKKLEYAAGLRYEYATRSFNADKLPSPYLLNLSNLFPSANLFYNYSPKLKIKAGFSKRVQRSTSNELNPYPEREHSETLEQGDPNIKPEFVSLTELGIVRNLKKGSLFATLYNQQIKHVVNRIYTNAGKAVLWGLETGLKLEPVKWWSIYLGGNVYSYSIKGELFDNTVKVKNSALAYSINTNHNFQINKSLSVSFNLNFLSQRPTAQGKDSRFLSPNLSIKKTFWKGKLSSTLQWQNIGLGILPSNEQRISTWGSNFYTTTNYIQEKDVLWIHLSYNFKKTPKLKLPNSEFGEKEF
jgi:outer membrane receptor protein involved in Fe transport